METVAIFIIGMFVGYMFYPQSEILGGFIRRLIGQRGCSGNCAQGRRPCDCGRA